MVETAKAQMRTGAFAQAKELLSKAIAEAPDNVEANYLNAVCLRYLKDFGAATQAVNQLVRLDPKYAVSHQERGHLCRALGDPEQALASYRQAVAINPMLPASWNAIAELERDAGRDDAARTALAEAQTIAAMEPALRTARSLFFDRRYDEAEAIIRPFLQQNRTHLEAMRLLAAIGMQHQVYEDAEIILAAALEIDPDNDIIRREYLEVLLKRHKYEEARIQAERLLEASPADQQLRASYAHALTSTGDFDAALAIYEDILAAHPDHGMINLSAGHAYKTVGKTDLAIERYNKAAATQATSGQAYWSLANLKTYRFTDAERKRMREVAEEGNRPLTDQYHMCFALAKAFEDEQRFDEAFAQYAQGNALKREELGYQSERISAQVDAQIEICTSELFARHKGAGDPSPDPIFIVGLPRAGSTLLEQILASHSMIDGTKELPNIVALAHRLGGWRTKDQQSRYPQILHELDAQALTGFGADFIRDTRIQRQDAPYFIDKMPNNFRHIGLIQLILPNATIIDARRAPMDCCFSNFKQLFAEGQEFTYGQEDIARYYADYLRLMDHWDEVLPGKVLRVQHEDVLDDLEGQVRRMLDHCGLPFEDQCVNFHETRRAVRTASSEQVRKPINRSGVGRWKPYEQYLAPLKAELEKHGIKPTA